jgi:hypothetical protein
MCKTLEEKTDKQARNDFLINMYNQAFNNINRHIVIVWQTISILAASFVSILLSEKYDISIWISSILLIVYIVWMISHIIDAEHWFKRNLHIITNIEKNFLTKNDLVLVHPYINTDVKYETMIDSFRIQIFFACTVWIFMLVYLFYKASITSSMGLFLIYFCISVILSLILNTYHENNANKIKTLVIKSPGRSLD